MLRLHIVSSGGYRRIVNFYINVLATELSWCGVRDCLGVSGQSEVAKPDLPICTACHWLVRHDVDGWPVFDWLIADQSDPGSMTTLGGTSRRTRRQASTPKYCPPQWMLEYFSFLGVTEHIRCRNFQSKILFADWWSKGKFPFVFRNWPHY